MSEKCYECGTIYDGWSCPMCSLKRDMKKAQEEAGRDQERMHERQIEAIEAACEETSYDIEQAADRHERAIAGSWKLQAEAKVQRAFDLYRADMTQDAINLCMDAIGQDPGNIGAYRVACWAHLDMGQEAKARSLLVKQIKLLKTGEYKDSDEHALQVLKDALRVQDNGVLISAFVEVSQCFGSGSWYYDSLPLIDELMKHSLYEEARQVFLNTISSDTLLECIYGIHLDTQITGKADLGRLNQYLKGLSSNEACELIDRFKDIESSGKFPDNVMDCVRKDIVRRYEEWTPDIESRLRSMAESRARDAADESRFPAIAGWIVGIVVLALMIRWEQNSMLGEPDGWFLLAWLIAFAVSILAGLITRPIVRAVLRHSARPRLLASLRKEEEQLRHSMEHASRAKGERARNSDKDEVSVTDKHERDYKGFGKTYERDRA